MNRSRRFRVNTPRIVHESLDDELVLIINLDSGSYYSFDKVGADVWRLIRNGASLDESVAGIRRLYDGTPEQIEGAVRQFVGQLEQEAIIVTHSKMGAAADAARAVPAPAGKRTFVAPVLEKFNDLDELLLLGAEPEPDEFG